MTDTSGEHLAEEPQEERGAPGSRDTGSDQAAGGGSGRVPGDIEHEETTSVEDENEDPTATFTNDPPQDSVRAVPPYEGRKETANPEGSTATGEVGGADVGGGTRPTTSPGTDAPAPASTPGGEYASPADEQPVREGDESAEEARGESAPTHTPGVGRGEDKR